MITDFRRLFVYFFFCSNIIDVAALDTHILEQGEYNDRMKMYTQRLNHQWNSVQINDVRYIGMLKDIPHPENHLATFPSADDVAMVGRIELVGCSQMTNNLFFIL